MEVYEMKAILDNLYLKDKEGWEQTRMLAYIMAQVNSTKPLKASDIMRFLWDKQPEESLPPSGADIERLRAISRCCIESGVVS